jgi:GAF domain-containing protein
LALLQKLDVARLGRRSALWSVISGRFRPVADPQSAIEIVVKGCTPSSLDPCWRMACETVDLSIRQFKPPAAVGDAGRLAALVAFDVLDSPPEPEFDDIVQIAATLCDTPIALVSLVSSNRQWFKARVGLESCETSLDKSVCAHGLGQTDLLIIPDLTADPRTCENTLVTGDPNIRFYAGAPLVAEGGNVIGMLCVIDQVARPQGLTLRQQSGLTALSRQVMTNLRLRHVALARDEHIRRQDADCQRRSDSRPAGRSKSRPLLMRA